MKTTLRKSKTNPLNPIKEIQHMLDLSDEEMGVLLDTSHRTIYRWAEDQPPQNYAPLLRLQELVALAKTSLREQALAEWFHEPNRALGGSIPIRLAADPRGFELVHDLLGNAAHGLPL